MPFAGFKRLRVPLLLGACTVGFSLTAAASPKPLTPEVVPKAPLPEKSAQRSLGFSNLILRPKDRSYVKQADGEMRVLMLEHMRRRGFRAVGAENLVFGTDNSEDAELLVGGTIFDLLCRNDGPLNTTEQNCLIGVNWEVLDVEADRVVYRAKEYHAVTISGSLSAEASVMALLEGVLDGLLYRPKFRALVEPLTASQSSLSQFTPAQFKPCSVAPRPLPEGAEAALDSVVILEVGKGHGSGFLLGEGPFVLTAAHVTGHGALQAHFRNGQVASTTVLRVDKKSDAALLRIDGPFTRTGCLTLSAAATPGVGSAIYVMGAPASRDLGFSIAQGITSGIRLIEGMSFIQTDASVNPGNSGGPFANALGEVVGIASWKLAGESVEGLGFGVPIQSALKRLALTPGGQDSTELLEAKPVAPPKAGSDKRVDDFADARPDLQPLNRAAAEKKRVMAAREALQDERTPGYVPVMRWGGLAMHVAGGVGILTTTAMANSATTNSGYDGAMIANSISWGLMGVGLGSFILSFPLTAPLPSEDEVTRQSRPTLGLTARGQLELQVGFQ